MIKMLALMCLCMLLGACGPREIGQGQASEEYLASGAQSSGMELMRYPMTGATNTQKMLYYLNKPEVVEQVQSWRTRLLRERMGIAPEDPAYRASPRQRSPFRQ